jgi:hypothetical protein
MTITWNAAFENQPPGTESIQLGDDRIRELKIALRERLNREMQFDPGSASSGHGRMRQGSARAFVLTTGSDPVDAPDGTVLDDTRDIGRVLFRSDTRNLKFWRNNQWNELGATTAEAHSYIKRDTNGRSQIRIPLSEPVSVADGDLWIEED